MLVRWQPRRRRGNVLVVLLLTGGVGWIVYRAIGSARQPLPRAAGAAEGDRRLGRPEPARMGGAPRAAERPTPGQRGPASATNEPTLTWRGDPNVAAGAAGLASAASRPASAGAAASAATTGAAGEARTGAAGQAGGVTTGAGAPTEPDAGGALADLGLRSRDDAALPPTGREAAPAGPPDIHEDTALGIAMRDTGDRERDLAPPTAAPGTTGPRSETSGAGTARAGGADAQQAIASAMDQIGAALDEGQGPGAGRTTTDAGAPVETSSPSGAREGGSAVGSSAPPASGVAPATSPKRAAGRGVLYETPEAAPLSSSAQPTARVVGGAPSSTGVPGPGSAMGLAAPGGAASGGGRQAVGESGGGAGERSGGVEIRYVETAVEDLVITPPAQASDPNVIVPRIDEFPAGGTSVPIESDDSAPVRVEVETGEESGAARGAAGSSDAATTAGGPSGAPGGAASIAAGRGGGDAGASGGSGRSPAGGGTGSELMETPPEALTTPPEMELAELPTTQTGGLAAATGGGRGAATATTGSAAGQGGGQAASAAAAGTTGAAAAGAGQIAPRGGVCPDDYPIKGNASSMIFHEPGSGSYNQTIPEVCFRNAAAAEAAGYRRPLSATRAARAAGLGEVADTMATGLDQGQASTSGDARREARGRGGASRRERAAVVPKGAVAGDGSSDCPADHPIKGNASSRLFHKPGQQAYDRTIPEVCFASAEDAENAGFRAAKQ